MRLILSIFILVVAASARAADSPQDPYCYDADKIFKRCEDQNLILEKGKTAATEKGKLVMIVYGYEKCAWCESIVKALYFSKYAPEIQNKYVIVPIASSKFYPSGNELISGLVTKFNQPEFAKKGLPQVVLINPASDKGSFIDLSSFERNTEKTDLAPAYSGFNVENVLKKIGEVEISLQ